MRLPRINRPTAQPRSEVAQAGQPYLTAWGLEPVQWRPLGGRITDDERATLVWLVHGDELPDDVALRARRAYDAIAERGTRLVAEATQRGIEIDLPITAVAGHMRHLGGYGILPDAVLVTRRVPSAHVRALRAELKRLRPEVPLSVAEELDDGWIAELRRTSGLS
jgi:exoribonuclease R